MAVILASVLVRLGSGSDVDEREMDARLNQASRDAIHQAAAAKHRFSVANTVDFARRALHGDFGESSSFGRPVAELLHDRFAYTFSSIALAWVITVSLAISAALFAPDSAGTALSGVSAFLMGVPSAVLALLFARLRFPVAAALLVAVLPQAYRFAAGILSESAAFPSVLAARSRGVGGVRLRVMHILLPAAPELIAITGMTLNMLVSAVIPIEALTGNSGLGHLVWQAALGRDLTLIAAMTLLVATATLFASSFAEVGAAVLRARRFA
jgi:peptide/nickel transport system permease protein